MSRNGAIAEGELLHTIETGGRIADADRLLATYDELEGVDCGFMLGTWRGGAFHYDHHIGRLLEQIPWYGKRFADVDDVEPLLVHAENGEIEPSRQLGTARMREIRFRGKVSAAMIYDSHPLIDHFRRVSADVVLGLADEKGRPASYIFHLTRA